MNEIHALQKIHGFVLFKANKKHFELRNYNLKKINFIDIFIIDKDFKEINRFKF